MSAPDPSFGYVDDAIEFAPDLPTVAPEPPWLVDAADLLAEPDPGPTPWLVEGLIVDQALVAAVGRWKTTKSYAVLDICISVATGRPAFGSLDVPKPGPVVFVNEESGRAALWRRLDALCRGRAIDPEELRGRLHVAANARVRLDDLEWQQRLLGLADLEPRLIVLDPLARMKAAALEENAQSGMAVLIDAVRQLRDVTGAAVLFVHHTGHTGGHMRGSSDLESAWESRLEWKREGTSPEVTIESQHREAESAGPVTYRIAWDGLTRSMRFDREADDQRTAVELYLRDHPEASANDVWKALKGSRPKVLELVKTIREQGGTDDGYHPGTTPLGGTPEGGTPGAPYRGPGTTLPEPGTNGRVPPDPEEVERLAARAREMGLE